MACKVGQKQFKQMSDLKLHMMSHAVENTNICDTCGKELVQKYNLRARHEGAKTVRSCQECKKQFTMKNIPKPKQLTQEIDMKKPTGQNKELMPKKKPMGSKEFICHACGRGYTSKYRLKRHVIQKHDNKKPELVCDLCNMEFKWEENLKIHLLCHRFEKPAIEPKSGSAIFMCETVFAEEDPRE
ncbi:hypothetical protein JTE90_026220 [Oedothorax gibbosus]|uniref:C2H2-type domain-containing protein n=1 Tax=Oedothorax gibbosus TaxID=931172 RepID=A0AAV6TZB9_9ARAC|nr:hypothetical protein JTE90_026220 [Oedothorax gibbosus]